MTARREHVTRLFSWPIEGGAIRLVAGTRSRLYVDTGDGNWQIIGILPFLCQPSVGDYLPVAPGRFHVDSIGNVLFVAHSESRFWTWSPGSPFYRDAVYDSRSSWQVVDDLLAMDIREAKAVCESNGFILIGNLVEENTSKPGVIRWSDYNDPRGWSPGGESLAGYADLGNGETILAIKKLFTGIRVFTAKSIWEGVMVGGNEVWRFTRIYSGPLVAVYPEAIVVAEDMIFFLTHTTIAALGPVDRSPVVYEWLDQAAGFITNGIRSQWLSGLPYGVADARCGIDTESPMAAVGGWSPDYNILMFFWATGTPAWPDTGMAISLKDRSTCVLDHGATAMCSHSLTNRVSYRRRVAEAGLCAPVAQINEGDPLPITFQKDESILYLVHPDEGSGIFPQFNLKGLDLTQVAPNGWYARRKADGDCCVTCENRTGSILTLVALTNDQSIKELDLDYFARDIVTNFTMPQWQQEEAEDGKVTSTFQPHPTLLLRDADVALAHFCFLWQTDALLLGRPSRKTISDVAIGYESELLKVVCVDGEPIDDADIGVSVSSDWNLSVQVGVSGGTTCHDWHSYDAQKLECRVQEPDGPTLKAYSSGQDVMVHRFSATGIYITIRIFADGHGDVNHIGPLAISNMTFLVEPASCRW